MGNNNDLLIEIAKENSFLIERYSTIYNLVVFDSDGPHNIVFSYEKMNELLSGLIELMK